MQIRVRLKIIKIMTETDPLKERLKETLLTKSKETLIVAKRLSRARYKKKKKN